ncbi:MAG: hypothetical protein AB8B79_21750 [Granulosicoccus sp.]
MHDLANMRLSVNRKPACKLLAQTSFLVAALLTGCGGGSSTPAPAAGGTTGGDSSGGGESAGTTGAGSDTGASSTGTVAASREALMSFMMQDLGPSSFREFWLCTFSDNSVPTYFFFNGTDDPAEPDFNPFLIGGQLRDAVLSGDPRGFLDTESNLGVVVSVEAIITSPDSMMMAIYPGIGVTSTPAATFDLTTIRLGPGRVFTTDSSLNNTQLTCTATDIGVDVFF